jgi:hypothetical protein
MVGKEVNTDKGGILNRGSAFCPEEATKDWEYYADWQDVISCYFHSCPFLSISVHFYSC